MSQDSPKSNPLSIDKLTNKATQADDTVFEFDDLDPVATDAPVISTVSDPLDDEAFFAELNKATQSEGSSAEVGSDFDLDADLTSLPLDKSPVTPSAQPVADFEQLGVQTADIDTISPQQPAPLDAQPSKTEQVSVSEATLAAGAAAVATKAATKKPVFGGLFAKKPKKTTDTGLDPIPVAQDKSKNDQAKSDPFAKATDSKPKPHKTAKAPKSSKSAGGNGADASSSNLLKYIILAALAAILLLVGVYWLSNQGATPVPAPTPAPTAEPAPEAQPTTEAPEVADDALPSLPDVAEIDVDAILNAEIPQDEALIKEEIDRLNDKDQQLTEQIQLIDEMLAKTEEMTKAKEEQIALLEKQIALLEQQNKQ